MKINLLIIMSFFTLPLSFANATPGMAKKITFVVDGLGGTKTLILDEIDLSRFNLFKCEESTLTGTGTGSFLFGQQGNLSDGSKNIYGFDGSYDGASVEFESAGCSPLSTDNIFSYEIFLRSPIVFTYTASLKIYLTPYLKGLAKLKTPDGIFSGTVVETY